MSPETLKQHLENVVGVTVIKEYAKASPRLQPLTTTTHPKQDATLNDKDKSHQIFDVIGPIHNDDD